MSTNIRKVLPLPKSWQPISLCGKSVAELVLYHRVGVVTEKDCGKNPPPVKYSILFGGMLPYHMRKELAFRGVPASQKNADPSRLLTTELLKNKIDAGRPIPLFVGKGVGHWVIVWGYDGDDFLVFDTAKDVERDENGLVRYTTDELFRVWGRTLPIWQLIWGEYVYFDLR